MRAMADSTALKRLRQQAALAAFPAPVPLGRVFQRLGFVQADPIRAPARAQDLILRHRVAFYRAGDLERRFARLGLEEAYLYAYGFMTPDLHALLLPRHDPAGPHVPRGLAAEVLEFVRAEGPTHPAALAEKFGRERETNGWGGVSKATTRALHALQHHGLLRVAGRKSGIRVYQAVAAPDRALSPGERLERLALAVAGILAPVQATSLAATMAPILRSVAGPGGGKGTLAALLARGALLEELVDGVRYLRPAGPESAGRVGRKVRFLAPFDPLVWDRRRFEHLYGWPYRFEAYVPPAKRKLGYYAMPLLWADRVIGWVNVLRPGGRIEVKAGFVGRRPAEAGFTAAFDEEVARMDHFLSSPGEDG